jgi:hypothetical protein
MLLVLEIISSVMYPRFCFSLLIMRLVLFVDFTVDSRHNEKILLLSLCTAVRETIHLLRQESRQNCRVSLIMGVRQQCLCNIESRALTPEAKDSLVWQKQGKSD